MPIIRANALRSLQSSLRYSGARATARAAAPARTQLVAKRFASSGSGGHGAHESSSDIPWLIGALVVTPPSMWYLWPEKHDEHHEEHGHEEHGSEEEEKPSEEEQAPEDQEAQEESAPAEKADESEKKENQESQDEESKKSEEDAKPSGSEGEAQPNPAKSESQDTTEEKEGAPDKDSNKSGVQFKGPMAEGSAGNIDERKSEPRPSKDSRVKRIDSGLGKNLGEGPTYDENDPKKESQATSKEIGGSQGDITQKQKGLSTTDTRHSTQIDQDPEKSKKGTGEPETAKAKGTVDPKAPARGVGNN